MEPKVLVRLEGLGLCEYCGALLSMEGMPVDAMDAEWRCPECEGILTGKSFGYEEINDEHIKTRWVDQNKQWTETKPTSDFDLGNWHILIKPLRMFF